MWYMNLMPGFQPRVLLILPHNEHHNHQSCKPTPPYPRSSECRDVPMPEIKKLPVLNSKNFREYLIWYTSLPKLVRYHVNVQFFQTLRQFPTPYILQNNSKGIHHWRTLATILATAMLWKQFCRANVGKFFLCPRVRDKKRSKPKIIWRSSQNHFALVLFSILYS
jgi:hypothetical protein